MTYLKIRYPTLKLIPNTLLVMGILFFIFYILTGKVEIVWILAILSVIILIPILIISFVRYRIFVFNETGNQIVIYEYILGLLIKKWKSENKKSILHLTKMYGSPRFGAYFSWAWFLYLATEEKGKEKIYLLTTRFFKKTALQLAEKIQKMTGINYKFI